MAHARAVKLHGVVVPLRHYGPLSENPESREWSGNQQKNKNLTSWIQIELMMSAGAAGRAGWAGRVGLGGHCSNKCHNTAWAYIDVYDLFRGCLEIVAL